MSPLHTHGASSSSDSQMKGEGMREVKNLPEVTQLCSSILASESTLPSPRYVLGKLFSPKELLATSFPLFFTQQLSHLFSWGRGDLAPGPAPWTHLPKGRQTRCTRFIQGRRAPNQSGGIRVFWGEVTTELSPKEDAAQWPLLASHSGSRGSS